MKNYSLHPLFFRLPPLYHHDADVCIVHSIFLRDESFFKRAKEREVSLFLISLLYLNTYTKARFLHK